jgi:hypothetical protein
MALSLIQQPALHQPAFNPTNFVLSSSNSATAGFRYKVDLLINGVNEAEFFFNPRADGRLWFNPERIVQSLLPISPKFALHDVSTSIVRHENYLTYKIDVTEYIAAASGDTYSGNTRYANAIAMSMLDYELGNFTNYYMDGTGGRKFQTNRQNIYIPSSYRWSLDFITELIDGSTSEVDKIRIVPYNSGGAMTAIDIANSVQGSGNVGNAYLRVVVGFQFRSVPADATRFEVTALNAADAAVSNTITFFRDDTCERQGLNASLFYLNRLGGWDALQFKANPTFETNVQRKQVSRILGNMGSGGYEYSRYEHQQVNYENKYDENLTLRSQYLNDEESEAMQELLISPQVYFVPENGTGIPCVITSGSRERRYRVRDGLFAGEIDIRLAFDNFTQRL